MTIDNDLEKSGILYGSNYGKWKVKMNAILRLNGLMSYTLERASPSTDQATRERFDKRSQHTSFIIFAHLAPKLRDRIPEEDRYNAKRLMDWLEKITTQFRFTNLPPELRARIYDYVINEYESTTVRAVHLQTPVFPTITSASKLLREEALPIFFSRTRFVFDFQAPSAKTVKISPSIRQWALKHKKTHLKLLRSAELVLIVERSGMRGSIATSITFKFSADTGLTAEYDAPRFTKLSQSLLADHIAAVEEDSKLYDMQGESIILALTCNPSLWQFGTLRRV